MMQRPALDWATRTAQLQRLATRRLFFVGGAPRSGTTWLQQMLDAHPLVACRGEGLFLNHLTVPIDKAMTERGQVIAGKNRQLFGHTGGFPLPDAPGVEHLAATAILLALDQFGIADTIQAVGEKTPENVFHFPRLAVLFPQARFIGIARDPRDVLASAWHFFGKPQGQQIDSFVTAALPSLDAGARAMVEFAADRPDCCRLVSYEALRADPQAALAPLFELLGVATDPAALDAIVAATAFERNSGGRPAGVIQDGSFFRGGRSGEGRTTFDAGQQKRIVDAMAWMFPRFGWQN